MLILTYLLGILGAVGYILKRQWWDPYHLLVAGGIDLLVLVLILVVNFARKKSAEDEADEFEEEEGGENKLGRVILGIILGVILAVVLSFFGNIAVKLADNSPLPAMFFDKERLEFEGRLEILKGNPADPEDDNWREIERLALIRLEEKVSPAWRQALEQLVYDARIGQARQIVDTAGKVAMYQSAIDWAQTHGIDFALAQAEMQNNRSTATPMPTYTPWPTQTSWPTQTPMYTQTPYPTATPYPTFTPLPTLTPYPTLIAAPTLPVGYVDCVNATQVEVIDYVEGEILRLFECYQPDPNKPRLYKIEWFLPALENQESLPYSKVVWEGDPKGAVWYPSRGPFRVTVSDDQMVVTVLP